MGTNSHTTQKAIISYFDKVFGEYMQSKTLSALLQKTLPVIPSPKLLRNLRSTSKIIFCKFDKENKLRT
ncbi:hypothetical protein C6N29_01380 [Flavobacterium columnare]|uniref:Uncharacterized protein n=1 Tax=Flavobacterium columnare (strain ATCC 49512 / CIP 103533 / TG 44/87) TaxID=1041826 RepID=G8X9S5_FLACA|nr:hypothetical protein FCOL_12370 [Flavobacterium columnare ATCC 49512]PTD16298.1 hypothetical protein C6N29_01380 [Flavobacterium columnare]